MASSSQGIRVAVQVVLAIVIVGLAYWLYKSITEPYAEVERRQELTDLTRERMDNIRKAMIRYENLNGRYPTTLDSLVTFIETDSLYQIASDSIFGTGFEPDSLPFSPRTGNRFILQVNDTARVKTYLLDDPDSDDEIGTLTSDVTRLNAASWE